MLKVTNSVYLLKFSIIDIINYSCINSNIYINYDAYINSFDFHNGFKKNIFDKNIILNKNILFEVYSYNSQKLIQPIGFVILLLLLVLVFLIKLILKKINFIKI